MSLGHGASTSRNGLVFQYDMANTKKSFKGKPTTNIVAGASLIAGPYGSSVWQLDGLVTEGEFAGWTKYSTTSVGTANDHFGPIIGGFTATDQTTYTSTVEFFSPQGNIGMRMTGSQGQGTPMERVGNTNRYSKTWTKTNGTGGMTFYLIGVGAAPSSSVVSDVYIRNVQIELGSIASPYVNGTRTNTEVLLDISGNNSTTTATSLTYNSDNTFSFNGTTDELSTPVIDGLGIATESHTFEVWCSPNSASGDIVNMLTGVGWDMCPIWISSSIIRGKVWNNATLSALSTVTFGQYYHVVVTYNHPGSISSLYVNGELQSTAAGTYSSSGASNFINIGQAGNQATGTFFNGSVPVFKVYRNTALTANEVLQNFEATRGRYGI
jgi:hypothetical protein